MSVGRDPRGAMPEHLPEITMSTDGREPPSRFFGRILAADEYTLQNLIWHLLEAGDSGRAAQILIGSPDWLRAKALRLKGDLPYLEDVRLMLGRRGLVDTPAGIGDLLCLHAARFNVYRRLSRYTYSALEVLVWLGRENEALNQTRARPTVVSGRALAGVRAGLRGAYTPQSDLLLGLLSIYGALRERDGQRTATTLELEHEIERYILGLPDDEDFQGALGAAIPVLTRLGEFGLAEALLRSRPLQGAVVDLLLQLLIDSGQRGAAEALVQAQDSFHRDRFMPVLIRLLAERGDFAAAQAAVDGIESEWRRPTARLELVVPLARARRFAEAEALLEQPIDVRVVRTAVALAGAYFDLGEVDRARYLMQVAESAVHDIPAFGPNVDDESAEERRVAALLDLARTWSKFGDSGATDACLERGAAYVAQIRWVYCARDAKALLLEALVDLGRHERAQQALAEPPFTGEDWLKATVATRLAEQGRWSDGQGLVAQITTPYHRMHAGLAISLALAKVGRTVEATDAYDRSLRIAAEAVDRTPAFVRRLCALAERYRQRQDRVSGKLVDLADAEVRALIDADNVLAEAQAHDRTTLEMPRDERELQFGGPLGWVALAWLRHGEWARALDLIRYGQPREALPLDLVDRQSVLALLRSARGHLSPGDRAAFLACFRIELESELAFEPDPGRRLAGLERTLATLDRDRDDERFYTTLAEIVIELTDQRLWLEAERRLETFNTHIVYPSSRFPEFSRALDYWLTHLLERVDDSGIAKTLNQHRDDDEWGSEVVRVQVGRLARAGAAEALRALLGPDPSESLLVEAVTQAAAAGHSRLADALRRDLAELQQTSRTYHRDRNALDACLAVLRAAVGRGDSAAVTRHLAEAQAIVEGAQSGRGDDLEPRLTRELARMGLIAEALGRLGDEAGELTFVDLLLDADATLAIAGPEAAQGSGGSLIARVLSVYAWEHTEWRGVASILAAANAT